MKHVILVFFINLSPWILPEAQATFSMLQKVGINNFEEKTNFKSWISAYFVEVLILVLLISIICVIIVVLFKTRKRLKQAKLEQMTIETSNRKMDFLTHITHEILTPLSLVISPVEDMMKNFSHAEWRNHVEMIYHNTRYIQKLIKQIIVFSRHKEGKLELKVSDTNLSELIRDVSAHFVGQVKMKDIEFEIQLPANEVMVKVDTQKIEEVLYILISNALKNTDQGHKISVSLKEPVSSENENSTEKVVLISIFNQSNSITENFKEYLFTKYNKIDGEPESVGITLWNSKLLIEMHGGNLDVEYTEGLGVTFHIKLPGLKSDSMVETIKLEKESENIIVDRLNNRRFRPGFENEELLKIVIADDNAELRNFLVQVFSRDYECYGAGDGIEAYKIITEVLPDVIILDVMMPEMDGLETCLMVKGNRNTCHIPVLLLTAKDADEQIISGFNNGADAYITKPFNTSVLLSQVSRLIKNRKLIREKYMTQNFMVEIPDSLPSKDDEFILTLRKILEDNISDADFNINKLSKLMDISTTQLYRKLKSLTGYSPVEFVRIVKLQKACTLLNQRKNTVKEVCYLVGFNNLSYFVKCFREFFGVTPAVYRNQGLIETSKGETNERL